MNLRRSLSYFLLVLLLGLTSLLTARAQEGPAPATPVPGTAPLGVLTTFALPELPTPHAEVWFLRMGLEPGGSLPADMQIGPTVVYVERGELTLGTDRPVTRSGGVPDATAGAAVASPSSGAELETIVRVGESVLIEDGTALSASNTTNEPATFLAVFMFSGTREGEGQESSAEPVGLSQRGISVAAAEFPAGPGAITMERVQVAPGETMESDSGHGRGIEGLELGAIEQGTAETTFQTGSSWLWPQILIEFQERQPIDPGATIDLAMNDGYSISDGSATWTVTSTDPLIVLRVILMPQS